MEGADASFLSKNLSEHWADTGRKCLGLLPNAAESFVVGNVQLYWPWEAPCCDTRRRRGGRAAASTKRRRLLRSTGGKFDPASVNMEAREKMLGRARRRAREDARCAREEQLDKGAATTAE